MTEQHNIGLAFREGRYTEALTVARGLPVETILDSFNARDAGLSALRLHRLVDAVSYLQLAAGDNPTDRSAWLGLATAWYELRQFRQSDRAFSQVDRFQLPIEALEARYRSVLNVLSGRSSWDPASLGAAVLSADVTNRDPDSTVGIADSSRRAPVLFSLGAGRNSETCLTIDDGPSRITTPVILDVLRESQVRAVFFLVGKGVERHPDLVDRILAEGHLVYSHSYSHPVFTSLSHLEIQDELSRAEEVLLRHRPTPSPYPFRLPGGMGCWDPHVHAALSSWSRDLFHVHWSTATRDHQSPRQFADDTEVGVEARARALEVLLDRNLPGSITLAHDDQLDHGRLHPVFLREQYRALIKLTTEVGMTFTTKLQQAAAPAQETDCGHVENTIITASDTLTSPAIIPSNTPRVVRIDSGTISSVKQSDRFNNLSWDLYLKSARTTWIDHSLPYAYGLHNGDHYVGALQAICARRLYAGRELTVCNLSSWYVGDAYRSASMRLMFAALNDLKGQLITALTPSPDAVKIYDWMKWQTLSTVRFGLLVSSLVGSEALADIDDVFLRLPPEGKRVLNDHRVLPVHHILIEASDRMCHFVYRVRDRENIMVADLLSLEGDPALLIGSWSPPSGCPLAECGLLIIEQCFLEGVEHQIPELNPHFRRPRQAKNFTSDLSFDFLYSEVPLSGSSLG